MNYHFANTLTDLDVKRHIPHHVDVPENCRGMTVHLHFEPAAIEDIRNMLTLTIFDPSGFRGAGHRGGKSHRVELSADDATPGYLAGPLPAGEWIVQIDTHMILPGEECSYTLDIDLLIEDRGVSTFARAAQPPRFDFVANPEAGWYGGDLHSHTVHSDASWTIDDLVAAAKRIGLDFVTLTDHNTTSPLAEIEQLSSPDLLTMGGIELTTFWGHAVCLGSHEWIDWRVRPNGDDMNAIAEAVYERENLFIIAHPKDTGDPHCTGCRWVYPQSMPGAARLVEVWNGSWIGDREMARDKNEAGLALYYEWLNAGHRLLATAGTDTHGPHGYLSGPGFNMVYAQELSERGIIDGIRQGHLFLTAGPTLHFNAQAGGSEETYMMGDTIQCDPSDTLFLHTHWEDAPANSTVRLIVNGEVKDGLLVAAEGERLWSFPVEGIDWCLVELRNADGTMAALTNPVFVG